MPAVAVREPTDTSYLALFPDWEGRRPLRWFFAESLLEARADSSFPTNSGGPDEDVNVYMVGLLVRWACGDPRPGVAPGADPLLLPPARDVGPRERAEIWRRQADHRLLALGLFDRGDLVRRRRVGWRMTEAETRARDLTVLRHGYATAAALVDARPECQGLVTVWRKLATRGDLYVSVLQTLARTRLGLGARLGEATLARLLANA